LKEFPDLKIGTVFQLEQKAKRKMEFGISIGGVALKKKRNRKIARKRH